MAKKGAKHKSLEQELRDLDRKARRRRHELKEAEKELLLCLKKCLKKLDNPPWHYGPRCPHGGGGGG